MHVQTILDNASHLGPAQPQNRSPPALGSSSAAQPQVPAPEAIPAAVEQHFSWLESTASDAEQPPSVISPVPGPLLLQYASLKAEELQAEGPLLLSRSTELKTGGPIAISLEDASCFPAENKAGA